MEAQNAEDVARDAIRHWWRLTDLAGFAVAGHGYGDSNGGFGVTYPGDLDDFDRASGKSIPDGFVLVYAFWGPPDGYEVLVPEAVYLGQLASVLSTAGHTAEVEQVRSLAEQRRAEPHAAADPAAGRGSGFGVGERPGR